MSFLSPCARKPGTSRRRLLGGLAALPGHTAHRSLAERQVGRRRANARGRRALLAPRWPSAPRERLARVPRCLRRARAAASSRSRPFSRSRRPGQRAPPHASPQVAPVGLRGARTGRAQAPRSGRPARGFTRPAPPPGHRSWALARGAWPWPGSPPQSVPPRPPPPPPQSVSQSVPSNGGRR